VNKFLVFVGAVLLGIGLQGPPIQNGFVGLGVLFMIWGNGGE